MSLKDKVVMITGARGNLGGAAARTFAAEGAKLILIDRTADDAAAMTDKYGVPCHTDAADFADPAAVDGLIARAVEKFGGIDALIHTVGGFAAGTPVHQANVDVLEQMFALNVRPIFVGAGKIAAHMVERGAGGKIVIVLAKAALKGQKDSGAYTASKAAAQRLVESMALELRDHHINVNGVLPSIIDTPRNREDMPKADFTKWVTPEQVADALLWLASDAANAVHGASIEVYGRV